MIAALTFCAWRQAGPKRALAAVALAIGADLLVGIAVAALLGAGHGWGRRS